MKRFYWLAAFSMLANLMWALSNPGTLVTTLSGKEENAGFSTNIDALDFNGDGYDDLCVARFRQEQRIYLFPGGPDGLNQEPTDSVCVRHTAETNLQEIIAFGLGRAGDVNGDGKDDLYYLYFTWLGELNSDARAYYELRLILGNDDFSLQQVLAYPIAVQDSFRVGLGLSFGLGDINADGYDDLGFTTFVHSEEGDPHITTITPAITFYQVTPTQLAAAGCF